MAGTLGGLQHMSLEWFRARSGANLTMVHYPSTAGALNDVMSGRVPVVWDAITSLAGPVAAGQIKLLALSSPKRLVLLPDIPPVADTLPGFAASGWLALVGPKGLPADIVQKLNGDLRAALARPGTAKKVRRPRHLHASDVAAGARRLHSQRTGHVAPDRAANPVRSADIAVDRNVRCPNSAIGLLGTRPPFCAPSISTFRTLSLSSERLNSRRSRRSVRPQVCLLLCRQPQLVANTRQSSLLREISAPRPRHARFH